MEPKSKKADISHLPLIAQRLTAFFAFVGIDIKKVEEWASDGIYSIFLLLQRRVRSGESIPKFAVIAVAGDIIMGAVTNGAVP